MNMSPSFTDMRSHLSHKFFTLRTDARRDAFWAKLMGQKTTLSSFPEEAPEKSPNRKFNGTEDIPVEKIVGTINRHGDFDHKFRPLNLYLRDRWVNVYLALERGEWPPILVHKVEDQYYVEDGHHRVSIAQALGITLIQANVWEYPCLAPDPKTCQPERSSVKIYVGVAD